VVENEEEANTPGVVTHGSDAHEKSMGQLVLIFNGLCVSLQVELEGVADLLNFFLIVVPVVGCQLFEIVQIQSGQEGCQLWIFSHNVI